MPDPVLIFAPYLTTVDPVTFGNWWMGRLTDYEGTWPSPRFEELARGLLSAFQSSDGEMIEDPVVLADIEAGVTGELPSKDERIMIQRAVDFAVLDRNPPWVAEDGNEGLWTSSSDNSEIFVWPLNLDEGWVTLPEAQ